MFYQKYFLSHNLIYEKIHLLWIMNFLITLIENKEIYYYNTEYIRLFKTIFTIDLISCDESRTMG